MIPQIEKTWPAGVMRVGFASEISAVILPPRIVVLPAKPLTRTVNTKAIMFAPFKMAKFVFDIYIHQKFCFRLYKNIEIT